MPIDRPNQHTARPLKPTLASNRTAKTPLTPRLAVAPTAASASSVQSTRPARSSNGGTTPRLPTVAQENITPVKAFLNSNITPRSSSRKSRVGGESGASTPNDTPNATPNNSRPSSSADFAYKEQGIPYNGLAPNGSNGAQGGGRPRSIPGQAALSNTLTPRLALSSAFNQTPSEVSARDGSSLFFHANDAKPQEQPAAQKKTPVFYFANGKQDDVPRRNTASSPPLSSVSRSQSESKFFHADSLVEPKDRPPILTPPLAASPELPPPLSVLNGIRSSSPTKDWAHLSYRKGGSQASRPALATRNSALSNQAGQNASDVPDRARRRSSVVSSVVRHGHSKSASLSSIDAVSELRKSTNEPSVMTPSPLHTESRIFSNASLPDNMASAPSPLATTFSGLSSPIPMSPTKTADGQSALEHMNELAANARRERKVLDLEISNSSLLAINRSLEKEVRKQKAELRRLRRMSRAGQFMPDSFGSALETYSATVPHVGDLSDMSEEEAEPEEQDVESSDSSLDESTLSPAAQAEHDEAQRLRDEKRLQLDLSKHRELLLDSQKMNQSLKKCLSWTEQLIKDGQKALDYKVSVSDVKLGGRVLISEDDHDNTQTGESRGLLSPWSPLHHAVDALESPFFPQVERLIDRDSGVDLDGSEASQEIGHTATPPNASDTPNKDFRPHIPGRWESYSNLAPIGRNERDNGQTLQPIPDVSPLGSPFEERIRHLHASIDALEAL